jgi:hypothetical protein
MRRNNSQKTHFLLDNQSKYIILLIRWDGMCNSICHTYISPRITTLFYCLLLKHNFPFSSLRVSVELLVPAGRASLAGWNRGADRVPVSYISLHSGGNPARKRMPASERAISTVLAVTRGRTHNSAQFSNVCIFIHPNIE